MAQAATIVDFTSPASTAVALNRAPDSDTTTTRTWNYDASTPFFDGDAASGQKIYSGYTATTAGELAATGTSTIINPASNIGQVGLRYQISSTTGVAVQHRGLTMWSATNFLSAANQFDQSANSSFTIDLAAFANTGTGIKGLRFVIQDGSNFYVSSNNLTSSGIASVTGDLMTWASFSSGSFTTFDNSAGDLGMGVGSFAAQNFNNVTGVGFIFAGDRTNTQGPVVRVTDFVVSAVPEPSSAVFLSVLGMLALLHRRRGA